MCHHVLFLCCRSSSKDIRELHDFVLSVANRINKKYGVGNYLPVVWVERPVSLYEKIALYSIADVAVVTATRDGMNLVPYEYIVCREGAPVSTLNPPFAMFAQSCPSSQVRNSISLMAGTGRHQHSFTLVCCQYSNKVATQATMHKMLYELIVSQVLTIDHMRSCLTDH